jgi:TolB protein
MAALRWGLILCLFFALSNGLSLGAGHWWGTRSELAFVSNRDGNNEIYLLDTTLGIEINVTRHAADDYDPAWSPDGTRVVFASNRDSNYDIYLLYNTGRDVRQLTDTPAGTNRNPAWSVDGGSVFYSASGILTGPSGVYRYGLVDDRKQFVSAADYSSLRNVFRDTTPDGQRTVRSWPRGSRRELFILTSEDSHQVTSAPGDKHYPVWSPDGQWIAYQTMAGFSLQIFVVDVAGQYERRLTYSTGSNYYPAWRPWG